MIKRVFLLLDLILFFQMVLYEKMNSAQTIMGNDGLLCYTNSILKTFQYPFTTSNAFNHII